MNMTVSLCGSSDKNLKRCIPVIFYAFSIIFALVEWPWDLQNEILKYKLKFHPRIEYISVKQNVTVAPLCWNCMITDSLYITVFADVTLRFKSCQDIPRCTDFGQRFCVHACIVYSLSPQTDQLFSLPVYSPKPDQLPHIRWVFQSRLRFCNGSFHGMLNYVWILLRLLQNFEMRKVKLHDDILCPG